MVILAISETKIDFIFRGIFIRLQKRSKADHPRYTKLLYIFAMILEGHEIAHPTRKRGLRGEKKDFKGERLDGYFAPNIIARLEPALKESALGQQILTWNNRQISLVS